MTMTLENLRKELIALPYKQRREMIDVLCESVLEEEAGPRVSDIDDDPELEAILMRRIEEIESGRVQALPGERLFENLERNYP